MNCEEYVIDLCNKKDEELVALRKNFEELANRCNMLQDAINFISKGVKLEKSGKDDYYVSVSSAWERYEKDAFDRYCAYFGLQKPENVNIDEVGEPHETPEEIRRDYSKEVADD